MKEILLIILTSFAINCNSQTKWLVKQQLLTEKKINEANKQIEYSNPDTLILQCNGNPYLDDFRSLYVEYIF